MTTRLSRNHRATARLAIVDATVRTIARYIVHSRRASTLASSRTVQMDVRATAVTIANNGRVIAKRGILPVPTRIARIVNVTACIAVRTTWSRPPSLTASAHTITAVATTDRDGHTGTMALTRIANVRTDDVLITNVSDPYFTCCARIWCQTRRALSLSAGRPARRRRIGDSPHGPGCRVAPAIVCKGTAVARGYKDTEWGRSLSWGRP